MAESDEIEEEAVDASGAIVLPTECGLKEVEEFLDAAGDVQDGSIVIDASEVEKMSAACVLSVLSAVNYATANSTKVAVLKPSSTFVDAFSELGFFQELMKMEFRQ